MPYSVGPVRFGVDVSGVTTSLGRNDPELGTIVQVGQLHYCFVYNDGGASAMVGAGVVPNSAATGYSVTVTATTSSDLCLGVVRNCTLTTGAYGWVVVRGVTPVEMLATSGTVSARGLIEIGANGLFAPVSNTTGNKAGAVGVALAEIVTGASGNAFITIF